MMKYVTNFNVANCPKREIKVLASKTRYTVIEGPLYKKPPYFTTFNCSLVSLLFFALLSPKILNFSFYFLLK